jgi:hypothetical protein
MEDWFRTRPITAKDLADRLLGGLNVNEVLIWPPDLFAYSSYILMVTSAYQLVVSPPSNEKWPPPKEELVKWVWTGAEENLKEWLDSLKRAWKVDDVSCDFREHLASIEQWKLGLGAYNKSQIKDPGPSFREQTSEQINEHDNEKRRELGDWEFLARVEGGKWRDNLDAMTEKQIFDLFRPAESNTPSADTAGRRLQTILKKMPPLTLACWAYLSRAINDLHFCNGQKLNLGDLLCNQDHLQLEPEYCKKLWRVSQSVLTLHAISDLASLRFGIDADTSRSPAMAVAEKLLLGKYGHRGSTNVGGTLSTVDSLRCRVLPKRHNPVIGITLRSISSNLAFHQSPVDVVWRKTQGNPLGNRLKRDRPAKMSILLLPLPLAVTAKDFAPDLDEEKVVDMMEGYGFFSYEPNRKNGSQQEATDRADVAHIEKALELIREAKSELGNEGSIDLVVLPEAAFNLTQFNKFEKRLLAEGGNLPGILIAGVRESKQELEKEMTDRKEKRSSNAFNFSRNAVYCKYYDEGDGSREGNYYRKPTAVKPSITPKYKQYKHHRWQLERTQIRRYGLSSILTPDTIWWESIKIPKRRVSFLNVGDRMTISHLICEDLARQDPIAELVRQVGPTLVVAILMDGPQLKNRWSARYATVLSDDPGSSVITLTSLGMVKRHSSEFGAMSRIVALWNESGAGHSREIELAQGAEAILLTLTMDQSEEKTADGRKELDATSILRLNDVIQIYPRPR